MECRHKSAHWMMKRMIILIVLEISTFNIKFVDFFLGTIVVVDADDRIDSTFIHYGIVVKSCTETDILR